MNPPTTSPTADTPAISTLPDEILQLMINNLDDLSICQLSLTCRRLHFFALPLFFERHDTGNLGNRIFSCDDSPREIIQAMRVALFVQRLSVIDFSFSQDLSRILADIASLRGLISRLPPIKCVTLRFQDTFAEKHFDVHVWEREFNSLLNTILDQPCESLEVIGGNYLPARYAASVNTTMIATYRLPEDVDHPHKIYILSCFLTPPFLSWTKAALQDISNSITTFSLGFVGIPWSIWTGLLVTLKFSYLETLQLWSLDLTMRPPDYEFLLKFLSRHPTMTSLTLSRVFVPPLSPLDGAILPHLEKLTAHSSCVQWLMRASNDSYPRLKSIEISLEQLQQGTPVDYEVFDEALRTLASNPRDRTIILSFFSQEGLERWFQKHINEEDASLPASFHRLKRLELDFNSCGIFKENLTDIFPPWLALFPCLDQVVFRDGLPDLDDDISNAEELLGSVLRRSPGLKSVALGASLVAVRGDNNAIRISHPHNHL